MIGNLILHAVKQCTYRYNTRELENVCTVHTKLYISLYSAIPTLHVPHYTLVTITILSVQININHYVLDAVIFVGIIAIHLKV